MCKSESAARQMPCGAFSDLGETVSGGGWELGGPGAELDGRGPEAVEAAQRGEGAGQVLLGERALGQRIDVALMHLDDLVAQRLALLGKAHAHRATVMRRALLHEVVVLDHFLDVV